MKKQKKTYQKPVLLKEKEYQTANLDGCTQLVPCMPNAAK